MPSSSEAWYGKGKAFLALNLHEEAVDAFDKVVELKPDFHDAWCDKGIALVLSNRHQDALHVLDTALRLDPNCAGAWMHRGQALFALGGLQEASRRFRDPTEQPYREASAERFQESS
jgi:tetratricopeptide (TPR) repeat protein